MREHKIPFFVLPSSGVLPTGMLPTGMFSSFFWPSLGVFSWRHSGAKRTRPFFLGGGRLLHFLSASSRSSVPSTPGPSSPGCPHRPGGAREGGREKEQVFSEDAPDHAFDAEFPPRTPCPLLSSPSALCLLRRTSFTLVSQTRTQVQCHTFQKVPCYNTNRSTLSVLSRVPSQPDAKHPTSSCARTSPATTCPHTRASPAPAQQCSIGYERTHAVKQLLGWCPALRLPPLQLLPSWLGSRRRRRFLYEVRQRTRVVQPHLDVLKQLLNENSMLRVVSQSHRKAVASAFASPQVPVNSCRVTRDNPPTRGRPVRGVWPRPAVLSSTVARVIEV